MEEILTLEKNITALDLAKAKLIKKNKIFYIKQLMHLQI